MKVYPYIRSDILKEIDDAISSINCEIYESTKNDEISLLSCTFDGNYYCIKFLDDYIWSDNDDEREYIDEYEDIREPLEVFLINKINEKLKILSKIIL